MAVMTGRATAQSLADIPQTSTLEQFKQKPKQKPKIVKYTVKQNDTLNSIAKKYHIKWERIYYKNLNIKHPDNIRPGQHFTIPRSDEKLKKRNIPTEYLSANTAPLNASNSGKLKGSIGYATCGGNCVNEPGVNNPFDGTNPISWTVLSQTPTIGATALWTYNHTGVVTGIWSNGDLEIRHQNFCGGQHRFSRSEFRGFR